MKKIAIVTGSSSGIGKAFVYKIARRYRSIDEIWVIARRQEPLEELKKQIHQVKIRPLSLDLSKDSDLQALFRQLQEEQPKILIAVQSAGVGKAGDFMDVNQDEMAKMIDLNCMVLTKVARGLIPYMSRGSYLYHLASSAAFAPQPGFGVYAATKAYVLSLSQGLSQELYSRNIRVVAVCPGPVDTAFLTHAYDKEPINGVKKLVMVRPDQVVEEAIKDARKGKTVSVCGWPMKGVRLACKVLPASMITKIMG